MRGRDFVLLPDDIVHGAGSTPAQARIDSGEGDGRRFADDVINEIIRIDRNSKITC